MNATKPIRIVIADDHPIVRKGLRQVIEEEQDLKVVGEASDGEACVALIDLDMPKLDGFGVARELGRRNIAVETVVLTIHSDVDLQEGVELGVRGFIQKESAAIEKLMA